MENVKINGIPYICARHVVGVQELSSLLTFFAIIIFLANCSNVMASLSYYLWVRYTLKSKK